MMTRIGPSRESLASWACLRVRYDGRGKSATDYEIKSAAAEGRTPNRGSYRHLPAVRVTQKRDLILTGKYTARKMAPATGVSFNTSRRERLRVIQEST